MKSKKTILSISMAAMGLGIAPGIAEAVTFTPLYTAPSSLTPDQQFDCQLIGGIVDRALCGTDKDKFVEEFVVESRIGNVNADAGVWEIAIKDVIPPGNANQVIREAKGIAWVKDAKYNLDFEYNIVPTSDGKAVFSVSTTTTPVTTTIVSAEIKDLFEVGKVQPINGLIIRTRTPRINSSNSSVTLNDIVANATEYEDSSGNNLSLISDDNDEINYLQVTGLDNNFKISAEQIFSWIGTPPTQSNLAVQIKAVTFKDEGPGVEVPEPSTISLFSLGIGGLILSRCRKK
jgi:hypothetical protein